MIPCRIEGATRYLGAPVGWSPDENTPCSHLAIRDEVTDLGEPVMISAWEVTPDELARLAAGGRLYLNVWGRGHPPVGFVIA